MSAETNSSLENRISELQALLAKRTRSEQEGQILALLRGLDPKDLALTLGRIDLGRLLKALDDRLWGPKSRKELLRLLPPSVNHLTLSSKRDLIGGLAHGNTDLAAEKMIAQLFLSEQGQTLTQLKVEIDCASNGHDLHHILHSDIDSADLRFDIIRHFQNGHTPTQEERELRVVCDIDDTLYASLNDQRYSKGTVYPGVLQLLGALSELPPIFLTARPELAKSLFERITHKQLSHYGIHRSTVLSGSLPGLMGHRRMAEQKARTLLSYKELYPEFRFIFIGDSGQGDMSLSESLLSKRPKAIERALIHKLADNQPGSVSKRPDIHVFDDYGVAATILAEHGYLNEAQVELVQSSLLGF